MFCFYKNELEYCFAREKEYLFAQKKQSVPMSLNDFVKNDHLPVFNMFFPLMPKCKVSQMNVYSFFCVLCRNSRCQENDFLRKVTVDSVDTLEIALSRTISEIKVFLHFTQKFKMTAKYGGKRFLRKVPSILSRYPAGQKFRRNFSISHHFRGKWVLCRNSRWSPKIRKVTNRLCIRLAPSLCISHSSKSDIHEIIMHPLEDGKILLYAEIQILLSAPHSGKKVIQSSYNTLDKRLI